MHTTSNLDGLNKTLEIAKENFDGLVFVNLVDTDMKYGHRRDVYGYAEALEEIDVKVGELVKLLKHDGRFVTSPATTVATPHTNSTPTTQESTRLCWCTDATSYPPIWEQSRDSMSFATP